MVHPQVLEHLATRVPNIPRVLGFDDQGREALSYLPGRVVDVETIDDLAKLAERAGGMVLRPPICGLSKPLAASATSRTISPSTRKRGPRASSRL